MSQKNLLSISEFSRLTGIKRENLRFYDRIGLLTPETRGENKYRYYSRHQLNTAYLISSLRGLGVGIEDIKEYTAERTLANTLTLFAQQDARIQREIRQLRETSLIIRLHSDAIRETIAHRENPFFLQEKEEEPIFLCPPIPEDMDDDEGGIFSYDYADANGINLGFPQGTVFAQEEMESGGTKLNVSYYFKVNRGGNAYKPRGCYAIAYGWCDIWNTETLHTHLLNFIDEQGLEICGNIYEEYPFWDLGVEDKDQSCIRVEIPVTEVSARNG